MEAYKLTEYERLNMVALHQNPLQLYRLNT